MHHRGLAMTLHALSNDLPFRQFDRREQVVVPLRL